MTWKYKNREDEILRAYVMLVQAMLIAVYDKIRIKKSWHSKKISQRMLNRKQLDLEELGIWLETENCKIWFDILGLCTGMGSKKMLETFAKTHKESREFIDKHIKKHPVDK